MTDRALNLPAVRTQSAPVEQRVLILAPTGNDARLTQRFLNDAGIHSEIVRGLSALCDGIREGCGTLLLAEETLAAETVGPLLKTISQQPSWSDIPLVLITSGGESSQTRLRRLTTLGPVGNVTMLERPFRPVTLLSAIETALRARGKQYQVRDLLKEVQTSERQVQSVLASIADGFIAVDRDWRFTYLNAAYLKLIAPLYPSADSLLGQNLWEKFPDLAGTHVEEQYRHALASQKPVSFELFYAPISTWVEMRVYPAPDALSIYVRDITERKRAEALGERRRLVLQLIAEDAPLEKIFEALAHTVQLEAPFDARVGIQLADPGHPPSGGNSSPQATATDRAANRMAISQKEADSEAGADASRPGMNAGLNISTDPTCAEMHAEARTHGLDGCWATPILSGHGDALGTFALFHAKSRELSAEDKRLIATAINTAAVAIERKRAEQALRASEAQLRLVTDHASVYLLHCDRDHRYKFVNRTYAQHFAREPQALLGMRAEEIMGAKAYAEARRYMDSALAGERVEFEHEIAFGDDPPRWMHTVYIPEYAEGRVVGFVGVINDVTSRKQSELELMAARDKALAASRAKDDFLAALSHELRTPLNPVLLIASEAASDPELPAKIREDFETIARNATLEARLIDDLLDLTRITHGKMSLDQRVIDLHAVLADALETVSPELREKKQSLNVKLATANCHIFGDPARVQQILWNVLKNVVKFTPQEGAITVETRCDKTRSWCAVRIQDSGIGMTDDEVGRVFDAFSQGNHAHGSGSHRFGGLGLGLAISRMLVALHSGKISASSKGKDRGSTFTIEFPLVAAELDSPVAPLAHRPGDAHAGDPLSPARRRHRILVVEDHVATRLSLTKLLGRRGYEIVGAGTVAEALQRAGEMTFDLVVSDIGLPDGDGYSLMERLRDQHGLTGVALSGYGMEQDIARGRAAGFTEHLIKPVNVKSLDRVLRGWEEALR